MQKIDSHQHFWRYNLVRDAWITEEMGTIKRNFLPTDLWPVLKENGINGCVAVQADQSEEETDFLLSLAAGNDFIKGVVGWIDLRSETVEEKLVHYSGEKKLKGFRHVLQAEPQRDYMLRKDFLAGLSLLQRYHFSYDILVYEDQLSFLPQLVEQLPDLRFVLDHIAKPKIQFGEIKEWEKGIRALAGYENVCCKISGMITEADWKAWKKDDFTPYLDIVTEAFGMKRLMFGSDWPVCLVAGSYTDMLNLVKDYFSQFSIEEQEQLFGGNATHFYQLT